MLLPYIIKVYVGTTVGKSVATALRGVVAAAFHRHHGIQEKPCPVCFQTKHGCQSRANRTLFFAKIFLAYTTYGAYEIFGQVFKCRSRLYAVVRIAYFGVVHPATCVAYILLHNVFVFNV